MPATGSLRHRKAFEGRQVRSLIEGIFALSWVVAWKQPLSPGETIMRSLSRRITFAVFALTVLTSVPLWAGDVLYGFITFDPPGATQSVSAGINDVGEIVGVYFDESFSRIGYLYSHGNFSRVDAPMAVNGTEVIGINNAGQVVGDYTDASFNFHPFLLDKGTFTALPELP